MIIRLLNEFSPDRLKLSFPLESPPVQTLAEFDPDLSPFAPLVQKTIAVGLSSEG